MRRGRPLVTVRLTESERQQLDSWAHRSRSAPHLARRARIIQACAAGRPSTAVAKRLHVSPTTVCKWRARFVRDRLDGLLDEPRPGTPRRITDGQLEDVVVRTLETTPRGATHWSTRDMAKASGLSHMTVQRIWQAFGLQPHRSETFKLSPDPLLIDSVSPTRFEYSATFGQAVKGDPTLTELYAKSTLCDYSYRYFYGDGFGKDYQILNLDEGTQQNHLQTLELYLVACLLSFFQQQRLYREHGGAFRPFHIESPLWIFVGGRVVKGLATQDASDIVEILRFLGRYVSDRANSIQRIERILNQGLVTATSKNLFAGRFAYLNTCGLSPAKVKGLTRRLRRSSTPPVAASSMSRT